MIIETHDLAKRYRKVDAVNGLNVSVEEGSAFALIGPNGAGKTTLIKLLVNILQPSAGSASVLGVDSRRISHGELARIGYVAENQELPGRLTVAEYFDYLRPFYSQWDKNLEDDIRRRMELPGERRIRDLSHGMRMKMTLACALPFRPELLVLDEPLSGLDPLVRDEIIEGVLSHAGETTILISSHELVEIENVVTHVAFLEDGKLLFQEATDDLYGRIKEIRVTLESRAALPAIPPQAQRRRVSVHTRRKMSPGIAPIVFRIPISCIRSRTDMRIVLITPTMAMRMAMTAMESTITRAVEMSFMIVSFTWVKLTTCTSGSL